MSRIRDGYCTVPNPFNRNQVARVSLAIDDVDAIAFWTRNPRPLIPSLRELDDLGFRYFFHFTVLGYPRLLDRYNPSLGESIAAFIELSDSIGVDRVIWRYDPIVMTTITDIPFHLDNFEWIAESLRGYTRRCILSIVDIYRKNRNRLRRLNEGGASIFRGNGMSSGQLKTLMTGLYSCGAQNGMTLTSCAEGQDLAACGIFPGRCIDAAYLKKVFDIDVSPRKDPGQRSDCGCMVSKDIGMYDSCLYECQYCYATNSFERAKDNFRRHDPSSPSLLGTYGEAAAKEQKIQERWGE